MPILQTAERISSTEPSDNYIFQRSVLAYAEAAKIVSGNVLEIGTGNGYGIEMIARKVSQLYTIDKFKNDNITGLLQQYKNVIFKKTTIPPLTEIASNSFDFVITFQVIEHIKNDTLFLQEIYRVLKPGGQLIITTPNKKMSLTRNPWHIREYTACELKKLCLHRFDIVKTLGIYGNNAVMNHYYINKEAVKKIIRFDVLNLQYRLPRWFLKLPYDVLNRWNRKQMVCRNSNVLTIKMDDYFLADVNDECLDLFYIIKK